MQNNLCTDNDPRPRNGLSSEHTQQNAQWEISIYFCHKATAMSYHSVTFIANEFCKAKLYPVHYNYHYCQTGVCCDLSHNCTQWEHCKYSLPNSYSRKVSCAQYFPYVVDTEYKSYLEIPCNCSQS